jgi:hypothetical protein
MVFAAGRGTAAGHSWFTADHVALVVSIVALVASIVFGVVSLYLASRSANAAEASAAATKVSAEASKVSAEATRASARAAEDSARSARASLEIARDQRYDQLRPRLRGQLVRADDSDGPNAWLEVQLDGSTPAPLASMLLSVPKDAGFSPGPGGSLRMSFDLGFPTPGQSLIRPGHPARWRVYRSDSAHGSVTATATCHSEDGTPWENVEVPISLD